MDTAILMLVIGVALLGSGGVLTWVGLAEIRKHLVGKDDADAKSLPSDDKSVTPDSTSKADQTPKPDSEVDGNVGYPSREMTKVPKDKAPSRSNPNPNRSSPMPTKPTETSPTQAKPDMRATVREHLHPYYIATDELLKKVSRIKSDDELNGVVTEFNQISRGAGRWIATNLGQAALRKYQSSGPFSFSYDWAGDHSPEAKMKRDSLIDQIKARKSNLEQLLQSDAWDPPEVERQ